MTTPICDFARKYAKSDTVRMHMPGHKGISFLGYEAYDITEIDGADSLFSPIGVIAESEANASEIFGCRTMYSTEGSSLCIRAMLYLAMQHAIASGRKPVIAAARNVHKAFVTAAVLLGFDILWINCNANKNYLKSSISLDKISEMYDSAKEKPAALYVTTPDYIGNVMDLSEISSYCHAHDMLLIADNAHGAYLHFLEKSQHPVTQGADLCCDSAHKTLPVLTGGAYLHIADTAPAVCQTHAKQAMALFASTSPSYLILQSLDYCNEILMNDFSRVLKKHIFSVNTCKSDLICNGFVLCGNEPMKMTFDAKKYGYRGEELANLLSQRGVICEFADPDYLVLMPSPYITENELQKTADALKSVPKKAPMTENPPAIPDPDIVFSPRMAMLSPSVHLPLDACIGRICAEIAVNCPPAVPIVICGERITEEAAACLRYYGITACTVMA